MPPASNDIAPAVTDASLGTDGLLQRAVAAGVAPGLSSATYRPSRGIEISQSGFADAAGGQPITADTRFSIASCLKGLTAAAALVLVDRGDLDLDRPVGDLLPHLAAPQVISVTSSSGTPSLVPARGPVTLRHLLTHTSGLGYDNFCAPLARYCAVEGRSFWSGGAESYLLAHHPGEGWQYGLGIDVVAQLIAARTDRRASEVIAELVLDPLGMTSTTFSDVSRVPDARSDVFMRDPNGSFFSIGDLPPFRAMWQPAVYSTPADYLRFLMAILQDGHLDGVRVLPKAVVAGLLKCSYADGAVGKLQSVDPVKSFDFDAACGSRACHTLGFVQTLEDLPGRRRAGSVSWAGILNTYFWADPNAGIAGVLFAQTLPFADPRMVDLFAEFEALTYDGEAISDENTIRG